MRPSRSIILIYGAMLCGVINAHATPKRIAVLELENKSDRTVSQEETSALTSSMRMILSHLPHEDFSVITRENIEVMLPPDLTLEDCVGQCAVETGRLLNAQWVVSGSVIKFGSKLKSIIKLHETSSGSYVTGVQINGESVDDLEAPIQLASLKLLYHIHPELKDQLVRRARSEDRARHLRCLLDEARCRPEALKTTSPSARPPERTRRRSKKRANAQPKRGVFDSFGEWVSKVSRIKLDKYNKQRVVFFDLKRGAFVHVNEQQSASRLLRGAVRRLNPEYFSVMSQEEMIKRLPPHSDMMCRQHSYCMTLGRMLGASWIFGGDLIRFGDSLSIYLRLYDVKTGLIRASKVLTGQTVSELEALMTTSLLRTMLNMEE